MTDERIEMARVLREVGSATLNCAKGLELMIKHMQEIDEKLDALAGGGFMRMKDEAGNSVLMPFNRVPDHPDDFTPPGTYQDSKSGMNIPYDL